MTVFKAVFKKDLNLIFRRSGFILVAVIVSLGLFMVFRFSLPAEKIDFTMANTTLWVVHLVASLFLLLASIEWEWEYQANRLYNITGSGAGQVFFAKVGAVFLAVFFLFLVDLAGFLLFLMPGSSMPPGSSRLHFALNLLLPGILTSLGLSLSGILSAAIAVHGRYRHVLLFVIKFPLTLPLIISASSFGRAVYRSGSLVESISVLYLEVAFIFLFVAAGVALYEYLLEE